jgi:hypothetical protein
METTTRIKKANPSAKTTDAPVKKSKIAIFWEKNPNGIIKVLDRRAVNR